MRRGRRHDEKTLQRGLMRRLGWITALALVSGSTTATAQVAPVTILPPAPPSGVLVRTPLLAPIALGTPTERSIELSAKLRMRVATIGTSMGPGERVHQRLASSMIDYYPLAGSGLHLSAGSRLYDVRVGEQANNRPLMAAQRPMPGAGGGRIGLRRTPALTLGYTGTLPGDTSLGFEVGAMRGRAYDIGGRLTRPTAAERGGVGNGPLNPVVNLVVGRRF